MRHLMAIFIKFVIVAVVLEIILGITTNLTFGEIITVSSAVTILAYIIGDMFILSATNNTIATVADIGLALFTIYMFNYIFYNRYISFYDALIAAAVIGVGEWFFHKLVAGIIFPNRTEA